MVRLMVSVHIVPNAFKCELCAAGGCIALVVRFVKKFNYLRIIW